MGPSCPGSFLPWFLLPLTPRAPALASISDGQLAGSVNRNKPFAPRIAFGPGICYGNRKQTRTHVRTLILGLAEQVWVVRNEAENAFQYVAPAGIIRTLNGPWSLSSKLAQLTGSCGDAVGHHQGLKALPTSHLFFSINSG